MNKIKRAALWVLSNAAFALALWAGYVGGIAGAHHIAVFFIWFAFIFSLLAMNKESRERIHALGPPVPQALDAIFDVCVISFLVWHGAAFLGVIYLLHTIFIHAAYESEVSPSHG